MSLLITIPNWLGTSILAFSAVYSLYFGTINCEVLQFFKFNILAVMATRTYSLAEVLAVAENHPFYNESILYPADSKTVTKLQESAISKAKEINFQQQPLLDKKVLYVIFAPALYLVMLKN